MRYLFVIPVALLLAVGATAQDDAGGAKREVTFSKIEDLPADLQDARFVVGSITALWKRKQLPKGQTYRLTVDRFFDSGHSESSEKFEFFVHRICPVDEEGRKHGEELVFTRGRGLGGDQVVSWKHGVRHGPEKTFARSPVKDVGTYVRIEIPWVDGKIHGRKLVRDASGKVTSETTFVHGQQEGVAVGYGPDGNVVSRVPYRDGKKNGKAVYYFPGTEQLKREATYQDDRINGETVEYYPNGKLKRKMTVKDSRMHGVVELYDEEGELKRQVYYLDGENVTEAEYRQRAGDQ